MKLSIALSFMFLAAVLFGATTADAKGWDNKGWVKLGERSVDGKFDKDKIAVSTKDRFSKLTLVVENSDMELLDFEVTFLNGETFHPDAKHYFKEGSRTRVIDLPGDQRIIKEINLKYKNVKGGGKASVEVWGWRTMTEGKPGNDGHDHHDHH